jgi:hypothetical protein
MSLDKLAFNTEKTSKCYLSDYKGAPLKTKDGQRAYVEVKPTDSDAAEARRQSSRRKLLDQVSKGKKIQQSPEQLDQDSAEILALLTVSWFLVAPDGEVVDDQYSYEKGVQVYLQPQFKWLREQVDEFLEDRANFI